LQQGHAVPQEVVPSLLDDGGAIQPQRLGVFTLDSIS